MTITRPPAIPTEVLDLALAGLDPDLDDGVADAARAGAAYGWNIAHRHPVKAASNLTKTQALTRDLRRRAAAVDGSEALRLEQRAAQAAGQAVGLTLGLRSAAACQRCGRALKDRLSVRRGVGPDCWSSGYRPTDVDDAELDELDDAG